MKSKGKIFLILIVVAIFSFALYQWFEFSKISAPVVEVITEKEVIKEETKILLSKPEISISSDSLEQGDTLCIKVKTDSEVNKISGELDSIKIDFFQPEIKGNWVGITGIPLKKKPGKYNLVISFSDGKIFEKELTVIERKFPITGLPVTEIYTPTKIAETLNKDTPILKQIFSIYTPGVYFNQTFIYPLKEIKIVGLFGEIRKGKDFTVQHLGVDLDAEVGTPIYAINDGIVRLSEDLSAYGKTLIIDHGFGIFSFYCHLNEFKVLKGEEAKRGKIIAFSGGSGYSTGPHLHLTIKINSKSVDPLRFIETIKKEYGEI